VEAVETEMVDVFATTVVKYVEKSQEIAPDLLKDVMAQVKEEVGAIVEVAEEILVFASIAKKFVAILLEIAHIHAKKEMDPEEILEEDPGLGVTAEGPDPAGGLDPTEEGPDPEAKEEDPEIEEGADPTLEGDRTLTKEEGIIEEEEVDQIPTAEDPGQALGAKKEEYQEVKGVRAQEVAALGIGAPTIKL